MCINLRLTSSYSSGNRPSIFLSQTRCGPDDSESQTRKRPAVSSEFNGTMWMPFKIGGGKVRRSSVDTHVALCSLQSSDSRHLTLVLIAYWL